MSSPGTLYIVATPIGNLEDTTYRAVRILGEVDLIAAEDTRHTRKLLNHFGITKPLTSYFDHNKALKGGYVLDRLRAGDSVALVSDAGTPCISDPGFQLVRDSVAEGIRVVPVPGSSAVITALSASGLPSNSFVFEGFLPNRQGSRRTKIIALQHERRVIVCYEAPKRLLATLGDICDLLGERELVVARELTKIHEEFVRGRASEVIADFSKRVVRGEVVILIAPGPRPEAAGVDEVEAELKRLICDEGLSLKDASKRVCTQFGLPRGEVYGMALRLKDQNQ